MAECHWCKGDIQLTGKEAIPHIVIPTECGRKYYHIVCYETYQDHKQEFRIGF